MDILQGLSDVLVDESPLCGGLPCFGVVEERANLGVGGRAGYASTATAATIIGHRLIALAPVNRHAALGQNGLGWFPFNTLHGGRAFDAYRSGSLEAFYFSPLNRRHLQHDVCRSFCLFLQKEATVI